jgi:hypothetical protein
MEEDSRERAIRLPEQAVVASISDLANQQLQLEKELEYAELALEELKGRLSRVRDVDLPAIMQQAGTRMLKLTNGAILEIKEDFFASIPEDKQEKAFRWFTVTGNDGLIKNEIKANFGKGQDAEAQELQDKLDELGYSYTAKRSVHPQTLKAFVRKVVESGEFTIPQLNENFSVHGKNSAKITVAKK